MTDGRAAKAGALALAEGALALASSHGMTEDDARRLSAHVYGKPAGLAAQECGGVAISLLAYHHAAGTSQRAAESEASARLGVTPPPRSPLDPDGLGMQSRMAAWVTTRIGPVSLASLAERSARIAEEAIELAQACDAPEEAIRWRQPGRGAESGRLAADVSARLLAWAATAGVDVRSEEERELSRIEAKPPSHFAPRQAAKAAAGIITRG